MFIGRTDVEAETPILWLPDAKSWLIWEDPGAGKDWGQEEKGVTEDEMAGWHHQLDGHEFGWTPGVGDGQGGLACCSSWGCKELDMTERLKWTELNWVELLVNYLSFCLTGKVYISFISEGQLFQVKYFWYTFFFFQPFECTIPLSPFPSRFLLRNFTALWGFTYIWGFFFCSWRFLNFCSLILDSFL